jgi:hypothetical protein
MAPVSKNTITARPLGEIPLDQPQLQAATSAAKFRITFFGCYYCEVGLPTNSITSRFGKGLPEYDGYSINKMTMGADVMLRRLDRGPFGLIPVQLDTLERFRP